MPELAIYVSMVFTLSALTAGSVQLMRSVRSGAILVQYVQREMVGDIHSSSSCPGGFQLLPELTIDRLMVFTLSALPPGQVELKRLMWRYNVPIIAKKYNSVAIVGDNIVSRLQVSSNRCQSSQSMY